MRLERQVVSGFEDRPLIRQTDEFSEQFSDPRDPLFWLRFEKPLSGTVVVTDAIFGQRDEIGMAQALAQALTLLGHRRPEALLFVDLGLAEDFLTGAAVVRVQRTVEAMVLLQRRFISAVVSEIQDGKVSLRIAFRNFD